MTDKPTVLEVLESVRKSLPKPAENMPIHVNAVNGILDRIELAWRREIEREWHRHVSVTKEESAPLPAFVHPVQTTSDCGRCRVDTAGCIYCTGACIPGPLC